MLRWLASLGIALLLLLDLAMPSTSIGRRGAEAIVRSDGPRSVAAIGEFLPDFTLLDLAGAPFRLADFRGKRILLTFERSVDW